MTTIEASTRSIRTRSVSPGRAAADLASRVWMIASVVVAIVPLGFVIFQVVSKGWRTATASFPDFFTKPLPIITTIVGGGMAPAIIGTLLITGFAALLAIPLGVLGGIYLNEYGRNSKVAAVVRFLADVMSGVPSIVMGLFIYTIFTLRDGYSGVGGSLALACLMLPIVIRSTEEMLKLVPSELRQASLALGTRQWRTTLSVVLPAAAGGIVSGSMLAIARAAGETAPLLFTIGLTSTTNTNLFHGTNTTLTSQIYTGASLSFPAAQDRAWAAALTLIAIVLLCTIVARVVASRFSKVEIA